MLQTFQILNQTLQKLYQVQQVNPSDIYTQNAILSITKERDNILLIINQMPMPYYQMNYPVLNQPSTPPYSPYATPSMTQYSPMRSPLIASGGYPMPAAMTASGDFPMPSSMIASGDFSIQQPPTPSGDVQKSPVQEPEKKPTEKKRKLSGKTLSKFKSKKSIDDVVLFMMDKMFKEKEDHEAVRIADVAFELGYSERETRSAVKRLLNTHCYISNWGMLTDEGEYHIQSLRDFVNDYNDEIDLLAPQAQYTPLQQTLAQTSTIPNEKAYEAGFTLQHNGDDNELDTLIKAALRY